jgi:AcrR family transcriptional regulator
MPGTIDRRTVARLPDGRAPAEALKPDQVERRNRLKVVAAELGERDGFERVQMTEIAKTAGVAIGTLYRYFPSKQQLFEILLYEELWNFAKIWEPSPDEDPLAEIGDQLVALTRRITSRPRLAAAMVQSATSGYSKASSAEIALQQYPLRERILRASGTMHPTNEDHDRAQLLVYAWWSVLVSIVSGDCDLMRGENQIRLAARLLLTSCSCWRIGSARAISDVCEPT